MSNKSRVRVKIRYTHPETNAPTIDSRVLRVSTLVADDPYDLLDAWCKSFMKSYGKPIPQTILNDLEFISIERA